MGKSTGKVGHNWTLDIIKWYSMIMLVVGHAIALCWGLGSELDGLVIPLVQQLTNTAPGAYIYSTMAGSWYGWAGYYSISFFTITAGFWFMNGFKKQKASGIQRLDRTFALTGNFLGDTLRKYWPPLFVAVVINFIVTVCAFPGLWSGEGLVGLWEMFRNAIPFLLGISAFGFTHGEQHGGKAMISFRNLINPETGDLIDGTSNVINYTCNLWFISALMIFVVIWYFVFLKSEAFGAMVWTPLHIAIFINLFGFSDGYMKVTELVGLPTEYWRVFGEFGWGIFAWYVVDYIKKNMNTPRGRKIITVAGVIALINLCVMTKVGNGSQMHYLLSILALLIPVISEVGYITPALNKVLGKIPGIPYVSTIALATYMYLPLSCLFITSAEVLGFWPWFSSLTWINQMWITLGFEFIWCVFYVAVVDRFIVRWFANKIGKAFKVKETIEKFKVEDAALMR